MLVISSVFITGLDASGRPADSEPFPAQAKCHGPTAQGWAPEATEETDGRPCSAGAQAGVVGHRVVASGYLGLADTSSTRVYIHPAAFQRSLEMRRCNVETRESATLMSCQRGRYGQTSHLSAARALMAPLASGVESEFARQTCRRYHDLGVGCACRGG
jgi:hypothetical protein